MTRIPKPYITLPTKEKEEIKKYMTEIAVEIAKERETAYSRQCLGINMKTSVIALREAFGMSADELIQFIGNYKRIWKYHNRLLEKGITENYLDDRITEIFGENGFPKDFVDNLLSQVELYEEVENG